MNLSHKCSSISITREAAKSSPWVGWRNDSRPQPPVLLFEFDRVREFSALHLYCNNRFMRDVQVRLLRRVF